MMILLGALLTVSACATVPPPGSASGQAEYEENDPIEPLNRAIFAFNRALDDAVLKPLARVYRDILPIWARARVDNALDNLRAPIIFVNDVLQAEPTRALTTLTRFMVNSTVGLSGANDVATEIGLAEHDEDFGQTLAVWGVGEGAYIMLPVFGPSNPRDSVGRAVDFLIDPFYRWASNTDHPTAIYARAGASGVSLRADLLAATDDLEKTSLDFYAAVRSLYRQRRAAVIGNGAATVKSMPGADAFPDWPTSEGPKEVSGKP